MSTPNTNNNPSLSQTTQAAAAESTGNNKIGSAPINPTLSNTTEIRKKYCRFTRAGIKYIDYKDPDFLKKFVNEQGKILPRRLTGTSLKMQRRLSVAVKRARHLGLLPFVTDSFK
jgi:small subunit ribosomal protein S18